MNSLKAVIVILIVWQVSVAQADQVGDMDGDGQVGLKEAIIALQVAAGIVPSEQLGQYIQASGNAAAGDVLAGKTFSNTNAAHIDGTMVDRGAVTITPTTGDTTIEQGNHNGDGVCEGDADLLSANIKAGTELFGVTGNPNVVDTTVNPAIVNRAILYGYSAYGNGQLTTGDGRQFWGCRTIEGWEWNQGLCIMDCTNDNPQSALECNTICTELYSLFTDPLYLWTLAPLTHICNGKFGHQ